jgi:hypothetical protein
MSANGWSGRAPTYSAYAGQRHTDKDTPCPKFSARSPESFNALSSTSPNQNAGSSPWLYWPAVLRPDLTTISDAAPGAPSPSRPMRWNEFLPISMPIGCSLARNVEASMFGCHDALSDIKAGALSVSQPPTPTDRA